MIDWITCKIQHDHDQLDTGYVMALDSKGIIQWSTPRASDVKGDHDLSIRLRSTGHTLPNGKNSELTLSGNPAKWLQGHNIFGGEDFTHLLSILFRKLDNDHSALGIGTVTPFSVSQARVSRVDFTKSLEFENRLQVREYIRQVGLRARSRNGRPHHRDTTCTFQEKSQRWTVTCYSKSDEINAHPLSEKLSTENIQRLKQVAEKLCRVELRLRKKELDKINCSTIASLTPNKLNELYSEYIGRIEMCTETKIPSDIILSLKPHIRATYLAWSNGISVRPMMSSRTFDRHSKELRAYGIDVSVPLDEIGPTVTPLHRTISGQPFTVPTWAYKYGLVA